MNNLAYKLTLKPIGIPGVREPHEVLELDSDQFKSLMEQMQSLVPKTEAEAKND